MYLFEYERRQSSSIMSLLGNRVRHACVSHWIHCAISHVLHHIWHILRVSRGAHPNLLCMYIRNIQHIVTYHILHTIWCVLYFAHHNLWITTCVSHTVYPANTPQTRTRMPPERTQCLYTPFSRVHPHIALNIHLCAVCV